MHQVLHSDHKLLIKGRISRFPDVEQIVQKLLTYAFVSQPLFGQRYFVQRFRGAFGPTSTAKLVFRDMTTTNGDTALTITLEFGPLSFSQQSIEEVMGITETPPPLDLTPAP
jgi:hypothetical protein